MVERYIYEINSTTGWFQQKEGYPKLTQGHLRPYQPAFWDGRLAYVVGASETGQLQVEYADRIYTQGGGTAWYWREPINLPQKARVIAAHRERLLLLQFPDPKTANPGKSSLPRVCVFDLTEGHEISSLDLKPKASPRIAVVVKDDVAYLFLASGELITVPFSTGIPNLLKEDFWSEAGLRLFRGEIPDMQNPLLFGRAFFDEDGTILFPAEPLIPFTKSEWEDLFLKVPEKQKRVLIEEGLWPPPTDRDIAYNEWATFLRLDPESKRIDPLPLEEVKGFIKEGGVHYVRRNFKDFDETALYGVRHKQIMLFANLQAPPKELPKPEGGPKGGKPSSKLTPIEAPAKPLSPTQKRLP